MSSPNPQRVRDLVADTRVITEGLDGIDLPPHITKLLAEIIEHCDNILTMTDDEILE